MYTYVSQSPIGLLHVAVTGRGLRGLSVLLPQRVIGEGQLVADEGMASGAEPSADELVLATAVEDQLHGYFDGELREFDLPLDLDRGSGFQRRVWEMIATIPFGEVASYAEVAEMAGSPGAFRAAGTACGANPVAIVTPCHRVIASGNRLGGYGLGIENKVWLLRHEGIGAAGARPDARVYKLEENRLGV